MQRYEKRPLTHGRNRLRARRKLPCRRKRAALGQTSDASRSRIRPRAQAGTVPCGRSLREGELDDIFGLSGRVCAPDRGNPGRQHRLWSKTGRRSALSRKPGRNTFRLVPCAPAPWARASTTTWADRRLPRPSRRGDRGIRNAMPRRTPLLAEALYRPQQSGPGTEFPDRELSRGADEARKAIALAPDEPDGYRALGRIHLARAEYDQAQGGSQARDRNQPERRQRAGAVGVGAVLHGGNRRRHRLAAAGAETRSTPRLSSSDLAVAYYLPARTRTPCASPSAGSRAHPISPYSEVPPRRQPRNSGARAGRRHVETLRRRPAVVFSIGTVIGRASGTRSTPHVCGSQADPAGHVESPAYRVSPATAHDSPGTGGGRACQGDFQPSSRRPGSSWPRDRRS